jgi:hypothetical protein
MSRALIRRFTFVAAIVGVTLAPAVASNAARVRPSQHFDGIVNGNHTNAVIHVACPGPVREGQTGPPTGSQYVAAILVESGDGFTGSAADSIVVTVTEDPSASMVLRQYGVARAIPTSLKLPCSGTGSVSFKPTPATAAGGAIPDTVEVTFENIAV